MLYYDRIDIGKGLDLAKSNNSKELMICHYFVFNHGFEFQFFVCNGCHDVSILWLDVSGITIITVKNFDFSCLIHNISKSEAVKFLENYVLEHPRYI